jgi:hypothetical protein
MLAPFTFLNCTGETKYEAQEKNAVSRPKTPQVANLQYSYPRTLTLAYHAAIEATKLNGASVHKILEAKSAPVGTEPVTTNVDDFLS